MTEAPLATDSVGEEHADGAPAGRDDDTAQLRSSSAQDPGALARAGRVGECRTFLEILFGNAPDDEWLSVLRLDRTTGDREVSWAQVSDRDQLADRLVGDSQRCSWIGAGTRFHKLDRGSRGGRDDVATLGAVFVDLDYQSEAHRHDGNTPLPVDEQDCIDLIDAFRFHPTMVVRSGYGLQVWWIFDRPYPAADVEPILQGFGRAWLKFAADNGVHIDNVFELARVMRVPGTVNTKLAEHGIVQPVRLDYDAGPRYLLEEIADHALWPSPIAPRATREPRELRPGDEYNAEADCGDLLVKAGWSHDPRRDVTRNGQRHYTRPGKDRRDGTSATVYPDGHCYIFSDAAPIPNGSYDAFRLYSWIHHGGDYVAAARDLRSWDYGDGGGGIVDWTNNPSIPPPTATSARAPLCAPDDGNLALGAAPSGVERVAERGVAARAASSFTISSVDWLLPELWWPIGFLSVLAGKGGLGKSTTTADLAAMVSCGTAGGHYGNEPRDVFVLSAEDTISQVLNPRLMASGADLDRIRYVTTTPDASTTAGLSIPDELDVLELLIATNPEPVGLVVLDPLVAYIGDRFDSHKDHQIRRALTPLSEMAARQHLAVVGVMHINKAMGSDAYTRLMGSVAFYNAVRFVTVFGPDPRNPDGDTRVLAVDKSNLGAKPASRLRRIERVELEDPACGYPIETVRSVDVGGTDASASDVLGDAAKGTAPKTEAACELIETAWLETQGAVDYKEIKKRLDDMNRGQPKEDRVSVSTIKAALKKLGGQSRKKPVFGSGAGWEWVPPDDYFAHGATSPGPAVPSSE